MSLMCDDNKTTNTNADLRLNRQITQRIYNVELHIGGSDLSVILMKITAHRHETESMNLHIAQLFDYSL